MCMYILGLGLSEQAAFSRAPEIVWPCSQGSWARDDGTQVIECSFPGLGHSGHLTGPDYSSLTTQADIQGGRKRAFLFFLLETPIADRQK